MINHSKFIIKFFYLNLIPCDFLSQRNLQRIIMEPQIIDHYNEYPSGINVIDKMNEELAEAQKTINKYAEILSVLVQNKVIFIK